MKHYCAPCDKVIEGDIDEVLDCPLCGMPMSEFKPIEPRFAVGVYQPAFQPAAPASEVA